MKLYTVNKGTEKGFPVYRGRLPTVCYVYRLWLRSLISKAELKICPDIYEVQEMLYLTSVVSAVPLLISVEKKTWLISRFLEEEIDNCPGCYHSLCSPPLEGFWTNPLVVVGEAPRLSQTG